MTDYYMLSNEDRNLIKQRLGSRLPVDPSDSSRYSSEVYIAKVPSGGIPALVPAAGTAAGEYDKPGFEVCDVYQVSYADSGTEFELTPISGLSYPVLNLQESEIAEGWILVVKEKGGKWVACVSGGDPNPDHWGVLQSDLAYGETTSVVLDVDSTIVTGVKAPKVPYDGYFPSQGNCLIRYIDGDWYLVLGPCPEDTGTGTGTGTVAV
jgi:hypothetical protein